MQISRALFPAQRHHRLADLIVRFGIADNEEHRALSDAIQTQQCFEWMRHYVTEHHESEAIRWKQAPDQKQRRNPPPAVGGKAVVTARIPWR